jgi:hypothetical protein
VNTENATIGNIMDSRAIVTLPLNGRTLDRLIRIAAGVTTDSASNPRVAGSAYWGGVQFQVDGITFNDMGNGGGAYLFGSGLATAPSVDAVSEFKIDSNNQKAEFEGSVAVSIVTKSGTNEFHGSAFEFNRNRAYAAKNGRATGLPKPPFNRNEFGFTLGGRIIKDRTFFFGGYEGLRERSSVTRTQRTVYEPQSRRCAAGTCFRRFRARIPGVDVARHCHFVEFDLPIPLQRIRAGRLAGDAQPFHEHRAALYGLHHLARTG